MLKHINYSIKQKWVVAMSFLLLTRHAASFTQVGNRIISRTLAVRSKSTNNFNFFSTDIKSKNSLQSNLNIRSKISSLSASSSLSLTDSEVAEIESQITAKGDEIRRLKEDGMDKAELAPYITELLSLKAKIAPPIVDKPPPPKKSSKKKIPGKSDESEMTESEIRNGRLSKVQAMKDAGEEPYAYSFNPTHSAAQLHSLYDGKLDGGEEDEDADVKVAGRIMTKRVFGKLAFFTIKDESGTIQLQLEKKRLGDSFKVCVNWVQFQKLA